MAKTPSKKTPSKKTSAGSGSSKVVSQTGGSFEQFAAKNVANSTGKPARKVTLGRTTRTVEDLPHSPGSLSQGSLSDYASQNNERASTSPSTGEVVGIDSVTGDSLVRQPGGGVSRVSAGKTSTGQTVNIAAQERDARVQNIRSQGTVVSSKLVSATGWQRKEGEPENSSKRISQFSVSQTVEDFDLLGDPCVPPSVKISIVQNAALEGIFIGAPSGTPQIVTTATKGLGGTVQLGAIRASIQGTDQFQQYLGELYQQEKAAGLAAQTLSTAVSLDSLGGTQTPPQAFSSGQQLLWKCEGQTCVQALDGTFSSREDCEAVCSPKSWSCINGTCVEIAGTTGQFKSQSECVNNGCNSRFTCVSGECVPDPNGKFETLEECQSGGCYWGYSCDNGNCVPTVGGVYKSLQCCQQQCREQTASVHIVPTAILPSANYTVLPSVRVGNLVATSDMDRTALRGVLDSSQTFPVSYVYAQVTSQGQTANRHIDRPGHAHIVQPGRFYHSYTASNCKLRFKVLGSLPTTTAEVSDLLGSMSYLENVVNFHNGYLFSQAANLPDDVGDWESLFRAPVSPYWSDGVGQWLDVVDGNVFGLSGPGFGLWVENELYNEFYKTHFIPATYVASFTSWTIDGDVVTVNYPDLTFNQRSIQDHLTTVLGPFDKDFGVSFWTKFDGSFQAASDFLYQDWNLLSRPANCFSGLFYQNHKDYIYRFAMMPGFDYSLSSISFVPPGTGQSGYFDSTSPPPLPDNYTWEPSEFDAILLDVSLDVTLSAVESYPTSPWEALGRVGPGYTPYTQSKQSILNSLDDPNLTNTLPGLSTTSASTLSASGWGCAFIDPANY